MIEDGIIEHFDVSSVDSIRKCHTGASDHLSRERLRGSGAIRCTFVS